MSADDDDSPYYAVEWLNANSVQLAHVLPRPANALDDMVVIAIATRDPQAPLAAAWFLEWSDIAEVHAALTTPGDKWFAGWATLLYAALAACPELGEAQRELALAAISEARHAALAAAQGREGPSEG